jgi:hypothetical protein
LLTVLAAVVFLVFLAIVLSSEVIVTDGENLSYSKLPICPTVSEVKHYLSKLWRSLLYKYYLLFLTSSVL